MSGTPGKSFKTIQLMMLIKIDLKDAQVVERY